MNMESFIKSKEFAGVVVLIVGLVLVFVYRGDDASGRTGGKQVMQETTGDSSGSVNDAQAEAISEIRDNLAELEEKLSTRLADIATITQKNMRELSELRKLKEESDGGDNEDMVPDNSEGNADQDPDVQEAQAAFMAESRQAVYMRQVEDFYASQQEDISWSVQVESDFKSAFGNYGGLVQLNSVSCGDVMCKVSANVTGAEDGAIEKMPTLDHIIHGDAKWQGQSLYKMNLDTGEFTLYLMREGVDLPAENG